MFRVASLPLAFCHRIVQQAPSLGSRTLSTSCRRCQEASPTPSTPSKSSAFFDSRVQSELRRLTCADLGRVFRVARRGQQIVAPEYRFVTREELRDLQEKAQRDAEKKLQMPPVLEARDDSAARVLDDDPALRGYDAAKLVVTDITYGVHERDRVVAVREADGVLREATWAERDRVNQVYFPREGRKIDEPAMFKPEALAEILGPERYEYVLDRNCVQFEPDHPAFIRTAEAVYRHVDEGGHYDALLSTRHYGPMVFHLAWERRADDLMAHYLGKGRWEGAHSLVRVFALLHPESASANAADKEGLSELDRLRIYIKDDSGKSSKVHICLESALEKMGGAEDAKSVSKES